MPAATSKNFLKKKNINRVWSFDVGVRNLSYSILKKRNNSKKTKSLEEAISYICLDEWDCIDILAECGSKAKKVYSVHTNVLVKFMITCLHKKFAPLLDEEDASKTAIVVEEQPGRSLRMKVLGYAIVTYFETISIIKGLNLKIEIISAKHKLTLCDDLQIPDKPLSQRCKKTLEASGTAKLKKQRKKSQFYRNNKWRAVQGCKKTMDMISIDESEIEAFKKTKKKDDLADAFLQGLWFFLN